MAPTLPRYLFRAWTDRSNGSNTPTLFKPAWRQEYYRDAQHNNVINYDKSNGTFKRQLKRALIGNVVNCNPFIFTTSSLLYAIQHCIDKVRGRNESNAMIVCIDTDKARTSAGEHIVFRSACELLGKTKIKARWTGDTRDYEDVWVTSDEIVPGFSSDYVSFHDLKEGGLFDLLPEFRAISRRARPGLETPVAKLRIIWFRQQQDTPTEEIVLAAKLASLWRPVGQVGHAFWLPEHLLYWLLALKGQAPGSTRLADWLNAHAVYLSPSTQRISGSKVPEVAHFEKILNSTGWYIMRISRVADADVHSTQARLAEQAARYKHVELPTSKELPESGR